MVNPVPLAEKTLYTVEEFEAFADAPENSDRRFELIHGEIVEKVPTEKHGALAGNIHAPLWNHVKPRKLGRVTIEPRHKMPLDNHNARLPDVAFTSKDRALPIVAKGSVPQMPDLAVEVQSPDDSPREMREKASYYLSHGSKLVWLVYPETKTIEVCTWLDNATQIQTLTENEILSGGDLLPEFALPIKDIFDVE